MWRAGGFFDLALRRLFVDSGLPWCLDALGFSESCGLLGGFEASRGSLGLEAASKARGRRLFGLEAGGVVGSCLMSS